MQKEEDAFPLKFLEVTQQQEWSQGSFYLTLISFNPSMDDQLLPLPHVGCIYLSFLLIQQYNRQCLGVDR